MNLKDEPKIQHQLRRLPMKCPKFPMIMQFSLPCPKQTTCGEQSLEDDKKSCLQIPAPTDQYFNNPDEFVPFLLQDSVKDDNERLLVFGNATMKNLLNLPNTWLVDGTFKLSPEIFNKFTQSMYSCTVLLHPVYMYFYRTKQKKNLL